MKKVIDFLENKLPLIIAGTALTTSVLLAIANALARYTLSHVINGADAIITVCFAYTVYVGSAVAFKRGQHYGVDVLVSKLSPEGKRIVQAILDVLVFVIMIVGFYLSLQLTLKAGNKRFEGLGLSYIIYDFSAVTGFGYSIIYAAEFMISDWIKLFKKEDKAA